MRIIISNKGIFNIVVAISLCTFMLAYMFNSIGITSEIMGEIIISISIVFLLFLHRQKLVRIRNYRYIISIIVVFGFGIIYQIVKGNEYAERYFLYFIVYCLLGILVSMGSIDCERVFKWMMVFSVPLMLMGSSFWNQIRVDRIEGSTIEMGASYAILPSVLAFILHFCYYRKKTIGYLFLYMINTILAFKLFFSGTRGASLAIMLCVFYLLIDNKRGKANKSKLIIMSSLGIFLITIFFMAQRYIILFLYYVLKSFNLYVGFIYKSVEELSVTGTILNGRGDLWDSSIQLIYENPLGIGVAGFEKTFLGAYPHNLFLQFILEYGWLLGVVLCFFIIYSFYKGITNDSETKPFILLLFFASIPRLTLSSTYWKEEFFWLFIIYSLYIVGKHNDDRLRGFRLKN